MNTKPIKQEPLPVSKEQFFKEASIFRAIITDRRNTIAQMDKAFGALFKIVTSALKNEQIETSWAAIAEEWTRRRDLMVRHGHPME